MNIQEIQEIHALKVINDPDYGSKMFILSNSN